MGNIEVLNAYEVKKIVTACPHCFNTIKNEYPGLGGNYEVIHHTTFLKSLLDEGRLTIEGGQFKGKKITFHDPCYLGRANSIYEAPRDLIEKLDAELVEMKRSRRNGLCCGAGGAQMFKEPEPGFKDVNVERTEDALETQPEIIAAGCRNDLFNLIGIKHLNVPHSLHLEQKFVARPFCRVAIAAFLCTQNCKRHIGPVKYFNESLGYLFGPVIKTARAPHPE